MRITELRIKNFRSIKDSGEIAKITKIFALIGRNNTGKSAFLKAIQVLFLKRSIDADDFHKSSAEDIEITGTIETGFGEDKKEIKLKVTCSKVDLKTTYNIDGKEQTKANYSNELPELLSINDIRNPGESTTEGQKATLLKQIMKLKMAKAGEKVQELTEAITKLKTEESKDISGIITLKFQEILNENNLSISISPTVELEKSVTYRTTVTDENIPNAKNVDILNSGTGLQSMYILALLEVWAEMSEKSDNAILLVEEPEVYLHPDYQRRMFAALRRIADNNQVIFTTHSPIMIADIWLTQSVRQVRLNAEGETQIEVIKIETVIDELGIRYEDVLNPSLVIFVEGKDDVQFYKHLGIENEKLVIISADGFRAIHYFAFIKIISSEHVNNNFFLIVDSDGRSKEERIKQIKEDIIGQFKTPPANLEERIADNIFVLTEYSIESYFLNETILQKAFPKINAADIKQFLEEYKGKYEEKLKEHKAGRITLVEFLKYLKPKLCFEAFIDPRFEAAYRDFWAKQPNFIKVRDIISEQCVRMEKEGRSWLTYILANSKLEEIKELSDLKKMIFGKLR
ncbi:MAG: AAA family ATPase [Minisyncoccia bacterium]|jgi:predicted ATP-dependent endonuclease of OLD family